MFNIDIVEKKNMKVLGSIVRFKRIQLGFSLRGLAEMTNISHTLISNFERGLVVPNKETVKDIFNFLELDFYDSKEMSENFTVLYKRTFRHILYYEFEEAKKIIHELEKKKGIYNNSIEVVNYNIIEFNCKLINYFIS